MTEQQADLIQDAGLFFVATADPDLRDGPTSTGPVNISPKGGVPLHMIDRNRVAYLDYTGSRNETARHSIAGGPIAVMVCAFEQEDAAIVRLYGKATATPIEKSPLAERLLALPVEEIVLPGR